MVEIQTVQAGEREVQNLLRTMYSSLRKKRKEEKNQNFEFFLSASSPPSPLPAPIYLLTYLLNTLHMSRPAFSAILWGLACWPPVNFGSFITAVFGQLFEYLALHLTFIILWLKEETELWKWFGKGMSFSQREISVTLEIWKGHELQS